MNDDSHPADALAQTFHDLISGEGFKQTIRQAWDRITSGMTPTSAHDQQVQDMNKANMDKAVQDANKSFLTPSAAANVRAKASKSIGGK